ncbi:MAG: phasin family protein [Sphingomonadaceae bacterium]|nr:phasin family protein [Sphingomonadaceae bacterium]
MAEIPSGKTSAKPAEKIASRIKASEPAKAVPPVSVPTAVIAEAAMADPLPALDVAFTPEPQVVAQPVVNEATQTTETAAPAPAAPVDVEMLKKGLSIMTDTSAFAATTEKAQAVFGEFNARAKAAAEKSAKLVEDVSDLTKGNVEAIVASGKIAMKGAEEIGAEYAAYGKASFEKATGAFKSFASVKSPTELLQLQNDYAKSSFDALVAESSKLTEAFVKLAGDVMQPLSSRFAVAAEKVKSATL